MNHHIKNPHHALYKLLYTLLFILIIQNFLSAQVAINMDGALPDSSAMMDVQSSNKGFLPPVMTLQQRDSIQNPANGLMVVCSDCGEYGSLSIFLNGQWLTYSQCKITGPAAGQHIVTPGLIEWHWDSVPGALGYKAYYTNEYELALDFGDTLSAQESLITCDTSYTRYFWAYNSCSFSTAVPMSLTLPSSAPAAPLEGIHEYTQSQITWKWNASAGATSYKWNTVNDLVTAISVGYDTTQTESSLNCDSTYTRYVWACNGCGPSTFLTLTQTTGACGCGDILVNHTAGNVAPVTKTVNYNTVINVPGETSKCWITKNLGATYQADSVSDTTEAAAGWYWQFNKKQGFTHDGISRLPNSIWQTPLNQYYNWTLASDPCSLELGVEWRIPTLSEWSNIEVAGNWTDWSGPWNSSLKLHAAGKLVHSTGNLEMRGSSGQYWSNTHIQGTDAWVIYLDLSLCHTSFHEQANGFTIRCIKD